MRVRMKVYVSGTRNGIDWPPIGGEIDVDDDEGISLMNSGHAEIVADAPDVESADASTAPRRRRTA